MTTFETLEISVVERIGNIIIAREQSLNAFNRQFFDDLLHACEMMQMDKNVRAIVLSGKGSNFSVGLDLKDQKFRDAVAAMSATETSRRIYREVKQLQRSISSLASVGVPTIACISGYCIGAGLDLAAACDMRIVSEDASFSLREVRIAMVADLGSLQRLSKIISRGHLFELALTGVDFSAGRAFELGLANKVCSTKESALMHATELAGTIASNSTLAVQGTKEVLRTMYDADLERDLDRVALWNAAFLGSHDFNEATLSFLEHRNPKFNGT